MLEDIHRLNSIAESLHVEVSFSYDSLDEDIQRMVEKWFIQQQQSWESLNIALCDSSRHRTTSSSVSASLDLEKDEVFSNVKLGM